MAASAVYVVQIRSDRAGVRALVRAATSATTQEFDSAAALWRFFVAGMDEPSGADRVTPEQRTDP
jgi:hypothetical protein